MALSKIDVANMVTGATPVANGGTGLTSGTTNQFLKFTGSTTLASATDNAGKISQVVSATTNIPLDRVIKKGNNIADAVSEESEIWQKIALLSGWSMWELGGTKKKKPTKSKSRVRR